MNTSVMNCSASTLLPEKLSYANAITNEDTAVMGAVGPETLRRVPPNRPVMIGITPAAIIPAKAPRPDITPNAAPRAIAAKLTESPARKSETNIFFMVTSFTSTARKLWWRVQGIKIPHPVKLIFFEIDPMMALAG